MKNMKVGRKIFTGFAVVIMMMLLITSATVITTTMINRNVDDIKLGSDLQTDLNEVLASLDAVRIHANIIYNTASDEANENFAKDEAQVRLHIEETLKAADKGDAVKKYSADILSFKNDYITWADEVAAVIAANNDRVEKGALAGEIAGGLMDTFVSGTEMVIAGGTDADVLSIMLDVVARAADVYREVQYMIDTFDSSNADHIISELGYFKTILQAFVDGSEDAQTRAQYQNALDECVGLEDIVNVFVETNIASDLLITEARSLGAKSVIAITSLTDAIDGDMEGLINDTKTLGNTSNIVILAVAGVSLLVAVIMGVAISRLITVPTKGLAQALDILGTTGSLALSPEIGKMAEETARRKDELGLTAASFGTLIGRLSYISEQLDLIAKGDLTSEITLASDADVMGISLKEMQSSLSRMFGDISASAAQVSTGSKQLADGAQSLAQGSTEQASAVQQLSGSITSIAAKTQHNAAQATQAAELSGQIRSNAQRGSEQMDNMIQAVQEINEASQSISRVIKVIDDIAFQTNILALNAAVEAARAGQHGKGFAVVAEEVRSLAAKSAEAAKDTGSLIENSMTKAELGARIASDTANSLTEIVSGINESTQIVNEIAQSSAEQSAAIKQVNSGIDQVAQVVQQNSATAEQSAAASQEMSGQSDMLEQLVQQFKLKGKDRQQPSLGGAYPQRSVPERYNEEADDIFGKY